MEDNRQFNNDGTPIQPSEEPTLLPEAEIPRKRRRPWNKIALFLIVLGLAVFGIGWATGARGASIVFSGGWFHVITTDDDTHTFMGVENFYEITHIYINAASARITIVPTSQPNEILGIGLRNISKDAVESSGNTLTINALGEPLRADYIQFDRGATIQLFGLGVSPGRREIRIQVPPHQMDSINIRSTSGNIFVEEVHPSHLEIHSSSGNINMEDIRAETLSIRSTSGNIRGENLHFSEGSLQSTGGNIIIEDISWSGLSATATSGNVRLSEARIFPVQGLATSAQTTSGNVRLEISNRWPDFSYNIRTNTGNVRIEGEGTRIRNSRRGEQTAGNGDHMIYLRTTSGNIRFYFGS